MGILPVVFKRLVGALGHGGAEFRLFELKRVSVGRAAEIAGIGKIAFMDELARGGVPVIDFSEEQIEHELRDV